jgi:hypothetical protein
MQGVRGTKRAMARYEAPDVSFDVPRDWQDRSVVAFAAPKPKGQAAAANVLLSREPLGDAPDLTTYANRQLIELAKRIEGFSLIDRRDTTFSGRPAVEIRFESTPAAPVVQRMVMIAAGQTVLSFTATAAKDEVAKLESTFERILSSVKVAGR